MRSHQRGVPLIKNLLHVGGLSSEPWVIHFGAMLPPMVVITHDTKTYMHQAQELAQFQTVQFKKAQRRASAMTQKERRELLLEARALLKESTRASVNGDAEASQRLQAKAASRKAGAASLCAPTTTRCTEVELLKGLEDASQNLRRLVTNARSSDSPHP
ncbi:hypothetical protein QYE76_071879 [Lolium multiflorum]|uniref:Uncharacterized protein n=1 Tax=Lolium multiflorum TaxID=4521 RepID=A0AAD8SLQ3_LOLMU|nr:hypothetical protein QYE76_071879 [Lolium multiflorum]